MPPPTAPAAADPAKVCTCKTDANTKKQGRHRAGCPMSSQETKRTAKPSFIDPDSPAWRPPPIPIEPTPNTVSASFAPPVPAEDILMLELDPLSYVPRKAKTAVAVAATTAFAAPPGVKWWMIVAFSKIVLSSRAEHVRVAESLIARAKAFSKLQFDDLLKEAREASKKNKDRRAKSSSDIDFAKGQDAPKHTPYSHMDECAPFLGSVDKCVRLARLGRISRAMAAMTASPVAPRTEAVIAELRDKHPAANGSGMTEAQRARLKSFAAPREVTTEEVVSLLRTFPPGSAAGPSGLLPSVLLGLMTHPGSPLGSSVAKAVNDVMGGFVPSVDRRFLFGAKLVPLVKKDKALRPIACSEVLRRVAAKALAGRLATKFREVLTPSGQIGVAVASGLEALASWTRRSALELGAEEAIAKIDFRNAFNSVHRSAIASSVCKHAPELARYVEAAYGENTLLFCGDVQIASEVGAQQGDPLGPVLFSIAALHCTVLPGPLSNSLRGLGWYLDDGLIIGPAAKVYEALSWIRSRGAEIGLVMNAGKTEILSQQRSTWAHTEEFPCWRPLDELELLGLPCSPSAEGLAKYVSTFVERLRMRNVAIEAVSRKDPHVGFLLLRMCTGFSASVHLARAQGYLEEFREVDAATIRGMDPIVPLGEKEAKLASLPFRLGGLGLRSVALHSATAFLAAHIETKELLKLFQRSTNTACLLPVDPLVAANTKRVPDCASELVAKWFMDGQPSSSPQPRKLQREFSMAIDDHELTSMDLDTDGRVRSTSCGSRGASLYLVGPVAYDDQLHEFFMDPLVFEAAVRLRLGLKLHDLPSVCSGCQRHVNDAEGHAALKCMKCGQRTRAHNALRDALTGLCRDALLSPTAEPRLFPKAPQRRADICFFQSGKICVVDVAITHPIRDADTRALAAAIPGGAATKYEDVKVVDYSSILESCHFLVPFVCDTYGALGQSAIRLLQKIVPLYARRLGLSSTTASRIVFGRITGSVVKSMATTGALL